MVSHAMQNLSSEGKMNAPTSTLFPYTTLFRSDAPGWVGRARAFGGPNPPSNFVDYGTNILSRRRRPTSIHRMIAYPGYGTNGAIGFKGVFHAVQHNNINSYLVLGFDLPSKGLN